MSFIKANIVSLCGLTLYFLWWLYLLLDFGKKEYDDNGFAGAVAVETIAELTILIIAIYFFGFLIAAFKTRKWKKYIGFLVLVLLPVLITIISFRL